MSTVQAAGAAAVRVAVLDGHPLVAEGLAALLERSGLEVAAVVPTWSELLEHPAMPVDVVLLDLHLDDGVLIARKVRALTALGSSAVVLSRRSDTASVLSAVRAGARGFVATGDSSRDLVIAVRTAAGGGHHLSDYRADALRRARSGPDAGLGRQEERALVLYAAGRSLREVAALMDTTEETVKSYLKRARRKYRALGIELGTRSLLREHAVAEGWATAD